MIKKLPAFDYLDKDRIIRDLEQSAAEFAEILKAEVTGVRDGDGTWHGADALYHAVTEIEPRIRQLAELYRMAARVRANLDDVPL